MQHTYPKLKEYCREKHGLEFQVVDMRWGVRDEATDDHKTTELCMQEIDNCQRVSVGPNFVVRRERGRDRSGIDSETNTYPFFSTRYFWVKSTAIDRYPPRSKTPNFVWFYPSRAMKMPLYSINGTNWTRTTSQVYSVYNQSVRSLLISPIKPIRVWWKKTRASGGKPWAN